MYLFFHFLKVSNSFLRCQNWCLRIKDVTEYKWFYFLSTARLNLHSLLWVSLSLPVQQSLRELISSPEITVIMTVVFKLWIFISLNISYSRQKWQVGAVLPAIFSPLRYIYTTLSPTIPFLSLPGFDLPGLIHLIDQVLVFIWPSLLASCCSLPLCCSFLA